MPIKKKLAFIFVFLGIFLLVLCTGLFFYTKSFLSPEKLKVIAMTKLQETFPGADIFISDIELHVGASFKLEVKKCEMNLKNKKKDKELFSVDNLIVKIPIWGAISSGTSISVTMDRPKLAFYKFDQKNNNWTMALSEEKDKNAERLQNKLEKVESEKKGEGLSIPLLFSNSKINVGVKDLILKYRGEKKDAAEIIISKFLLKDFNLKDSSAFEIDSNFKYSLDEKKEIHFGVLVIGQFDLSHYLTTKMLPALINIKIRNTKVSDLEELTFPVVDTNVDLTLNSEGIIEGKFKSEFDGRNKINSRFKLTEKGFDLINMDSGIYVQDILNFIKIKNNKINAESSQLKLEGDLFISSKGKISPFLKLSLNPALKVIYGSEVEEGVFDLTLKEKDLNLQAEGKILGGVMNFDAETFFDIEMLEKFSPKKLRPIKMDLVLKDMKIDRDFILKNFYKDWGKKKEKEVVGEKKRTPVPLLPMGRLHISLQNLAFGSENLNGKGEFLVEETSLTTKKLDITYSKGKFDMTSHSEFEKNKIKNEFKLKMKEFNLESLKVFLPPIIENVSGDFSGDLSGQFDILKEDQIHYNVVTDVKARNGEIKGLDLADKITSLFQSNSLLKGLVKDGEKYPIDGKFEIFELKALFRHDKYSFNEIFFRGSNRTVELKNGKGEIYPPLLKKVGNIDITLFDYTKSISKFLIKNTKSNQLPLRFKGEGFSLMPDLAYTAEKLAKKALKKNGEEVLQKQVEKVINKNEKLKKLINDDSKKKINNVLKGLFK